MGIRRRSHAPRGHPGYVETYLAAYGERSLLALEAAADGAALWAAPGTPQLDGEHAARLIDLLRRFNGDRTELVVSTVAAIQPPPEPHWYLNVIAARSNARSRGVGARLLEPQLERADREGLGVYLESSNPRNLSFYDRYGFERWGEAIDLPGAGPILQPMWRPAPAGRGSA